MKKILNFLNLKQFIIVTFLLFILICSCAYSYANTVSSDLSNTVFRLHVIANSDSLEDQNLKYKVRDKVLEYMNTLVKDSMSKSEVISIALSHQDNFSEIAKNVISENGYDYDVTVSINNVYFPTKEYGDISLPSRVL